MGDRVLVPRDPFGDLGADGFDADGGLGEVGGDGRVRHDNGDGGVAGDVAVEQPERGGDRAGRHVVVHRHRVAVDGGRVAPRSGSAVDGDPAEELTGGAVAVEIVVG